MRGSTAADIVLFALAVTFVPALALLVLELAAGGIDGRAGLALHLLFVGGLGALFAVQALERLGIGATAALVAGAVAAGVLAALAVWRVAAVRTFLTILTPAPLVFLGVFLFASSVTKLVLPADADVDAASVRSDVPVVVVVFDELPVTSLLDEEGEVDAGRYPSFARLAREATWFRNATTLSASTTVAVPALLTGQLPDSEKLPVFQDHPRSLFTLLGDRYRMNVFESQTRLCPRELCEDRGPDTAARLESLYSDARVVYLHLVAPPALEDRLPAIDEGWGNFGDETTFDLEAQGERPTGDIATFYVGREQEFERFVASIRPHEGGQPSLNFLHVLLPHGPWLHFPSQRISAVANPRAPGRKGETWRSEALALQAFQRHLLQLGYTDALLGELIRQLEAARLYDRALVVVTADHGISFRGGGERRNPTAENLAELAFVPLFVKLPDHRRGRAIDRHVTIVDILPTIADALDVDVPWPLAGRSGYAPGEEAPDVRVRDVAMPYEQALAQREEALARQTDLFGSGGWDAELFGFGPYADLLGRPVYALEVAGRANAEATVDEVGSRLLRSLPAGSRRVPSPLSATLTGELEPETHVAVALNGEVAAVTQAYESGDGSVRLSALAPESAFRPGENDVRVFAVEGAAASPSLREIATTLSS